MSIIPIKLLSLNITTITPQAFWNEDDGTGDPWIGNPYRWTVEAVVNTQTHSSHLTSTPFVYDGNDILEGMWIADIASGLSVKIVTINSQNASQINCIVEDVERFNCFSDPSQNGIGIGSNGLAFCFSLGLDGLPILGSMSSYSSILNFNSAWQEDLISRHRARNNVTNFVRVQQISHGFSPGDLIRMNSSSQYVKAQAIGLSQSSIIGRVVDVGTPGVNFFTFKPFGEIRKSETILPGTPGTLLYLNPTIAGSLTDIKPSLWSKPVAIRLETNKKALFFPSNFDAISTNGYTNNTYQVNTIPDRDALIDINVGDQVRVNNVGNNRWGIYLYTGPGTWGLTSTQESVATDAQTLNLIINYNSLLTSQLIEVLTGSKVIEATIRVITAFDGTTPTITIGDDIDNTHIMDIHHSDLKSIGFYEKTSDFVYSNDTNLKYYLNTSGSTIGSLELTITYVR